MENLKSKLMALSYCRLIDESDIESLAKKIEQSNKTFEDFILDEKIASLDDLYKALSMFYEIPYTHLDVLDIDSNLIEKFGLNFLKKHKVVPIKITDKNIMIVALSKPYDFIAKNAISVMHDGDFSYVLVSQREIDSFLNSLATAKSTANALQDMGEKGKTAEENDEDAVTENNINAPAVRLVDSIIRESVPLRASDIHIEPLEKRVIVRYRMDGDLVERLSFDKKNYPSVVARLKIISGMNIAERRVPQDGHISMKINDADYDFRLSTLPTIHGEKFVIRVLDKSNFNVTRKELGFRKEANDIIDKILAHPHGLVLLTGPTGCGKSTSLYCFLKEINKPNVNIVTVEDPVEYNMDGINQIQVNPKADLTFATTLRSILRQDPDIIMVGEIRDEETAHIAVRAAITGHLVFSTLHTNNATGAVARLTDMGVNAYLVSDALVGVISQRLVKRLCPKCKQAHTTTLEEMKILGIENPVQIFAPKGCKACNHSGYKGRMAVNEIMYVNDKLRSVINKDLPLDQIRKAAIENGLLELVDCCKKSVLDGDTSIEQLLSLSTEE